jgi:putative FmdB family regulatory protein
VPTYDYRCQDCGHQIEIMHSILEDGPEACERCRGPLVRVLHPAGVIFKGSGFYKTDSRKTDSRPGSEGSTAKSDAEGGAAKSAESKSSESKATGDGAKGSGGKPATGAAGSD